MHNIKLLCAILCTFCFTSLVFAQVNSNYPGNAVNIDCCADQVDTNIGYYYFVVAPPARTFECKLNLQRKGGFRNWIDLNGNDQTPFNTPFVDPSYSGYGYEGVGCTTGGVGLVTCGGTPANFCSLPNNAAPFALNRVMMDDGDYADSQYSSECYTSGNGFTGRASTQSFIRTWNGRVPCPASGVQRATQLIEIRDNEPPQLSIPADITLECSSDSDVLRLIGNADAFDACYPVDVTVNPGTITGNDCARVQQFTWTAQERNSECQLATQAIQRVTVVDTTPPVIQKLPSYTIQCTQPPLNIPATTPTATDSCFIGNLPGTAPVSTDNFISGPCAGTYTIERTWSVSDICGNTGYQVQYIFVEDVTPPTFVSGYVPTDTFTSVDCFQDIATSTNFQNIVNLVPVDDCSGPATIEEERYVENDGSANAVDNINYVQEFTASDSCGNSVSWANRFSIASIGPITQTLGLTGATTATKGTAFNVNLAYTPTPACAGQDSRTAVTVDAGAATLNAVTGAGCLCTQQATGTVFCNNVPSVGTCTLSFTVPTTFLPNSLLFSASVNVPAGEIFGETTHFVTFS